MIILSVDPGFERVGIAIIEKEEGKKESLIYSSCFKTSAKIEFHERLNLIGQEIERIIKKYKPESLAIEKLYFTTNQKTVMGVSEARGVIIYCSVSNGLLVSEYTPPQIKLAVTGYGKADKKMVINMIPKLIKISPLIKSDDELDAIAIGLTHLAFYNFNKGIRSQKLR